MQLTGRQKVNCCDGAPPPDLKHLSSHLSSHVGILNARAYFYVAVALYKGERFEENAFIPGVLLLDSSELASWNCRLSVVNSEGHEVNTRFLPQH